jgi:hypothetical protein
MRYPWQDESWFGRLLPLALLQLIPVVGQLIFIGYGQAVARATYSQQSNLPRLQLRRSFVDGLRLAAVGLVYFLPVILMVVLVLSPSDTAESETAVGAAGLILPLIMVVYMPLSSAIGKRRPALKPVLSAISAIGGVAFALFLVMHLGNLFTTLRGGFQLSTLSHNAANVPLLLIAGSVSIWFLAAQYAMEIGIGSALAR